MRRRTKDLKALNISVHYQTPQPRCPRVPPENQVCMKKENTDPGCPLGRDDLGICIRVPMLGKSG